MAIPFSDDVTKATIENWELMNHTNGTTNNSKTHFNHSIATTPTNIL